LREVAELVVRGDLEAVAYESAVGPITALDMLFGHGRSIERGNSFMTHHTGLTVERAGRLLIEAGFHEARVSRAMRYELWALALMPQTDKNATIGALKATGRLDFSEE
jgi:hypothetical protein